MANDSATNGSGSVPNGSGTARCIGWAMVNGAIGVFVLNGDNASSRIASSAPRLKRQNKLGRCAALLLPGLCQPLTKEPCTTRAKEFACLAEEPGCAFPSRLKMAGVPAVIFSIVRTHGGPGVSG